jgi:Ca2+-binding RTX toxin-like protein
MARWAVTSAAGVLAVGSVAVVPGSASAATGGTVVVGGPGTSIAFSAGAGDANDLRITKTFSGAEFQYLWRFDDVVPVSATHPRCERPDPADDTVVECTLFEQPTSEDVLDVRLGDGADRMAVVDIHNVVATVYAGSGNDRVSGQQIDVNLGEAGNDVLSGSGTVDGGTGHDTISNGRTLRGGDGNDTITGQRIGSTIEGGRGDDTVQGGVGRDIVHGNSGDDEIRGAQGSDDLFGGPGDDVVFGNSGNDVVEGGPGRDTLSGGPGNDRVRQ